MLDLSARGTNKKSHPSEQQAMKHKHATNHTKEFQKTSLTLPNNYASFSSYLGWTSSTNITSNPTKLLKAKWTMKGNHLD
jgi:hypothetical protein